jgi:hypothetical protein
MKRALVFTFAFCFIMAGSAIAGTLDGAVIAMHASGKHAKFGVCEAANSPDSLGIACSSFITDAQPLRVSNDVYIVVAKAAAGPGVGGCSFGILRSGPAVGFFGFTLCADLQFPNGGWPNSGGGNRITWVSTTNCQRDVIGTDGAHAVAGSFYLYATGNGTVSITPNNGLVVPELKVSDCNASESDVTCVGAVGFGTSLGYNPCTNPCATPVEPTTWGAIKSLGTE